MDIYHKSGHFQFLNWNKQALTSIKRKFRSRSYIYLPNTWLGGGGEPLEIRTAGGE